MATSVGRDGPAGSARGGRPPHLFGAELALFALSIAAVYGFSRIFETWSFFWPLVAVAVVVHTTAGLLRRRGAGVAASFVVVTVAWALVVTWTYFFDTTFAFLPTPTTWDVASAEIERAWSAFHQLVAPAPALTGFQLAAAVALGAGIFLADWAAFRLWSSREAVVPSLTLFVFATLLAGDAHRIPSAVAYVSALLAFVLLHRVARLERSTGWVTAERAAGGSALLRVGVVLGVVAIIVGAVAGPRLPGADEAAIFDWRAAEVDSGRVTVSPLVDIRSRLVQRSETQVFTVRSARPAYWRLTALDDFDGNFWRSSRSYEQVADTLPNRSQSHPPAAVDVVEQQFTIQNLSTLWLPAAYLPTELAVDATFRYQPDTSTLIVDRGTTDGNGARYTVTSEIPSWTPDQLDQAGWDVPPSVQDQLDLPASFPDVARTTADEVVAAAGADTPFAVATALQEFFRGFTYDLEVDSGHDGDAIADFLEQRRGYCEQFAGTFAAMARYLGLPARVAVGFTWGDPVDGEADLYQVRGRNAHAWPEVYLADHGWVAFEPTPGRGSPTAISYTGQVPSQEAPDPEASGGATTTLPDDAPTTTALDGLEPLPPDAFTDIFTEGNPLRSNDTGSAGRHVVTVGAAALAVGGVAYLGLVPGARQLRRSRRRRASGGDPRAEVGVAWAEATEYLAAVRLAPHTDETHTELAARAGVALPDQAPALARLATAADTAAYAPDAVDTAAAEAARADADDVGEAVRQRLPWPRRLLVALDPRTVRRPHATPRHRVDRPHG